MSTSSDSYQFGEETAINRAITGDLDAFNDLILRYQDMAYNHAFTLLGDPASADDATQESFIKAFKAIKTFRGGSFRGWLLKIVTHSVYDMVRRSNRYPTQPLFPEGEDGDDLDTAPWLADPAGSIQDSIEQSEFAREISRVVADLPKIYRDVIVLVDVDELDYTEAAEILNVPVGTVKSRLARARFQLRDALKELPDLTGYWAGMQAGAAA